MDIDMAALRALDREKEIPLRHLVAAIEQALLIAYHRTEGAQPHARVELDRTTGHVTVLGRGARRATATSSREYDDTPEGFGRIAAITARQVILQRLRDAEDEQTLRRVLRREGDVVSRRRSSRARDPRDVLRRPRQGRGRAAAAGAGAGRDLPARRAAALPASSPCARACAARRSRCRAPTRTW